MIFSSGPRKGDNVKACARLALGFGNYNCDIANRPR